MICLKSHSLSQGSVFVSCAQEVWKPVGSRIWCCRCSFPPRRSLMYKTYLLVDHTTTSCYLPTRRSTIKTHMGFSCRDCDTRYDQYLQWIALAFYITSSTTENLQICQLFQHSRNLVGTHLQVGVYLPRKERFERSRSTACLLSSTKSVQRNITKAAIPPLAVSLHCVGLQISTPAIFLTSKVLLFVPLGFKLTHFLSSL